MISKKEIFQVASKIFGLYAFTRCFFAFEGLVAQLLNLEMRAIGLYVIDFGLNFIFGLILVKRSDDISNYLIRDNPDSSFDFSVDKLFLIEIVFVSIGLTTVITNIPTVLVEGYRYINQEVSQVEVVQYPFKSEALILNAAYLVVGYLLISNARFFANKVFNARQKAIDRETKK